VKAAPVEHSAERLKGGEVKGLYLSSSASKNKKKAVKNLSRHLPMYLSLLWASGDLFNRDHLKL